MALSDDWSICESVVRAVAEYHDLDPLELNQPLGRTIDVDSLERLCGTSNTGRPRVDLKIEFTFHECRITVTENGEIKVTSPEALTDD